MEIILARHGEAESGDGKPDPERELVEEGRQQALLMGRVIAATLGVPAEVWSSPLRRAQDTARIAASTWPEKREPKLIAHLGPGCDLENLCWLLSRSSCGLVMLVGHMPDVGGLAARLLGLRSTIAVQKGGMVIVRTNDPLKPVALSVATLTPGQYRDILEGRQYAPWMRKGLRVAP